MKNPILAEILMKVETFPGLPRSGVKIMAVLKDESNTSVSEIEKILRYDPGLTANFLKLANSPFFGIPSKVSSVKQAIILLGTNRLKDIVLATCASDVLGAELPGYNLDAGDLWRHSIAISNVAVALAKYKKLPEPNNIFTPALLHDIGKLILGRFVEKHFKVINELLLSGLSLEIAENMVLGTDHAEIGAQILTQWSFPRNVVNAVRLHHNPELMHVANIENDLLYLANLFGKRNGANNINDIGSVSIYPALRKRLGIEQNKLNSIFNQITKWVDGISEKLTLE